MTHGGRIMGWQDQVEPDTDIADPEAEVLRLIARLNAAVRARLDEDPLYRITPAVTGLADRLDLALEQARRPTLVEAEGPWGCRYEGPTHRLMQRGRVRHFELARPTLHDVFVRIAGPQQVDSSQ